jgi:hypothetical protein
MSLDGTRRREGLSRRSLYFEPTNGDSQWAELCDEQPNHPSNQTNTPRFLQPKIH